MTKLEKRLREEIQLAEGEGCIIFNIGYQLSPQETDLQISFCLGMEDEQKCEHLPLIKGHEVAVKNYGDKLSTVGYPYKVKLDESNLSIVTIHFDTKRNGIPGRLSFSFGINGMLSEKEPLANVTVLLNYTCFTVFSIKNYDQERIYLRKMSTYRDAKDAPGHDEIIIEPTEIVEYDENSAHVIYGDVLDFHAASFTDYIDVIHPKEANEEC